QSTARVLPRTRRPRTVPGRRPINPSRKVPVPTLRSASFPVQDGRVGRPGGGRGHDRRERRLSAAPPWSPPRSVPPRWLAPRAAPPARRPPRRWSSPGVCRRRRVLAALGLLNVVKLAGVVMVGPGFGVGFAVTGTLPLAYLVHLRGLALADQRRRRAEARRRAWLAAQQALVRREQQRRAAARRAAARRTAAAP